MTKILTKPQNALLKQYQYMFGLDSIKLTFTKNAMLEIAKRAKKLGTNARGLKNILDKLLLPYQFDAKEMKNKGVVEIKIDETVILEGADPMLIFKESKDEKPKKQNSK